MQKIWISGARGQIGRAINSNVDKLEYEMLNTDIDELDITDIDEVLSFGKINRPDIIINCSGITNTLDCENNPIQAYKVNALGARNLSIVAQRLQAKFVQISSDDVFDGTSNIPYTEYDFTKPKTVYGKSKLAGENYVKEFTSKHYIIRSTWVYGKGTNFVNQFLEKIKKGETVNIASDHVGSPTSADDLAKFILTLIKTNEYGTFHATSEGTCTRFEFAQEILKLTGLKGNINPVAKIESDFSSKRPEYVVLDNFVLSMLDIFSFPKWQDALLKYLRERGL